MASKRPVSSPSGASQQEAGGGDGAKSGSLMARLRDGSREQSAKAKPQVGSKGSVQAAKSTARPVASASTSATRTRTAHLRLTRIDPLSVMKMAFLLSIALGVVMVVAVTIIWSVLSAVGVWDNINAAVQQVIGTEQGEAFDVSEYVGTSRVVGFSLVASVINVVLLTAIATLAAFVYNLAAALLGGVEVTLAEDR